MRFDHEQSAARAFIYDAKIKLGHSPEKAMWFVNYINEMAVAYVETFVNWTKNGCGFEEALSIADFMVRMAGGTSC
ncbi:MAG: hypothetical protein LBR79_01350 [Oscillospiraceae bacterium]|jgi:hypothetical protein|nr:hypothetical protein [Oscillospiraceae bacterium]